ncbi:MAG: DUF1844 domain-containing protein [Promethearchaeota archaeon]
MSDEPPSKPSDASQADPKSSTETEDQPPGEVVDIAALPVWQIIPIFLGILDRVAWQRIGLVVNPQSQKIEKDLEQARVAIDCYEKLLQQVGDKVPPDVKRHFEGRLTDLKLNYSSHQ